MLGYQDRGNIPSGASCVVSYQLFHFHDQTPLKELLSHALESSYFSDAYYAVQSAQAFLSLGLHLDINSIKHQLPGSFTTFHADLHV